MGRIKGICKNEGCEHTCKSYGIKRGARFYATICNCCRVKMRKQKKLAKDEGAGDK